jgi:hypothetical protein
MVSKIRCSIVTAASLVALVMSVSGGRGIADAVRPDVPRTAGLSVVSGEAWIRGDSATLIATRLHSPSRSKDGEALLDADIAFTIPVEVPVIAGSGGSGALTLKAGSSAASAYTCRYRASGASYWYQSCSPAAGPGTQLSGRYFHVHVVEVSRARPRSPQPESSPTGSQSTCLAGAKARSRSSRSSTPAGRATA